MDKFTQAEQALAEILYRNPNKHDGHAYDLELALWGLGLVDVKPDAEDYGQDTVNIDDCFNLASDYASIRDDEDD